MPVMTDFLLLLGQADDLDFVAHLDLATLHSTGSNGAAAGDGEDVLDGHQEGQVESLRARSGDIVVDSVHQLLDAGILRSVGIAETRRSGRSERNP